MDITALTQLIGSLGFPIACCFYMMTTMNKTLSANTEATNSLRIVVEKLITKFGVDEID